MLTDQQILLLKRGPKFCPRTKGKVSDYCGDTKIFTKKLIMQESFFDILFKDESLIREPSKKYINTYNTELTGIVSFVIKINPECRNLPEISAKKNGML